MFDTRRLARTAIAAVAFVGGTAAMDVADGATTAAAPLLQHHTTDSTTGPTTDSTTGSRSTTSGTVGDGETSRTSAPARRSDLLAACPIEGDHDLHDSWGWPRSGGRRHQGIDVSAPRGTELYAVRDGMLDVKQSRLGGNSAWLVTDDGDRFFYAHLDGFAGDDRAVVAGELIGWVGSTGNARGPHLHFETHPDGAVENPFEHVVDACTPPAPDPTAIHALIDRMADVQGPLAGGVLAGRLLGVPGMHHPR